MNKTTQIGIDGILDQSDSMNKNLPSRGIGISDECVYDHKFYCEVVVSHFLV